MQLMRMKYVPEHSGYHAYSEYLSYVGVDCKAAKFTGNRHGLY